MQCYICSTPPPTPPSSYYAFLDINHGNLFDESSGEDESFPTLAVLRAKLLGEVLLVNCLEFTIFTFFVCSALLDLNCEKTSLKRKHLVSNGLSVKISAD